MIVCSVWFRPAHRENITSVVISTVVTVVV